MSASHKPAHFTPTSFRSGILASPFKVSNVAAQSSAAIALNMIWQLVAVVVLPIVGGHLLDVHFSTSPILMCVGMAIAAASTVVVVRAAMRELNQVMDRSSRQSQDDQQEKDGKK